MPFRTWSIVLIPCVSFFTPSVELVASVTLNLVADTGFENVDDTSGFSLDNSFANLGTATIGILGDGSTITGFAGGQFANLTHRGTRGIGIEPDEFDEVDPGEMLDLVFSTPWFVEEIEVRSLFIEGDPLAPEQGIVNYFHGADLVHTANLIATSTVGNGAVIELNSPGILADRLSFVVSSDLATSEFALARLELTQIPEASAFLCWSVLLLVSCAFRRCHLALLR